MGKFPTSAIDPEAIKGLLGYDPDTGDLRWLVKRSNRTKAGDKAGSRNGKYWSVEVNGKAMLAHRVAWMLSYGDWPDGEIDHIDCDPSNNRLENLRVVTRKDNCQNQRKAHSQSTTGILGVHRKRRKFQSSIQADGVIRYLGMFETAEEAQAAYMKAKSVLHLLPEQNTP